MSKFIKLILPATARLPSNGLIAALIAVAAIGAMQGIGTKLDHDVHQRLDQALSLRLRAGAAVPKGAPPFFVRAGRAGRDQ